LLPTLSGHYITLEMGEIGAYVETCDGDVTLPEKKPDIHTDESGSLAHGFSRQLVEN
jgi:hypothetical protein